MKRSNFLKSLVGVLTLPPLLVNTSIGKELPYEVLPSEFKRVIPSEDVLSNLIDDIISKNGVKLSIPIGNINAPNF